MVWICRNFTLHLIMGNIVKQYLGNVGEIFHAFLHFVLVICGSVLV